MLSVKTSRCPVDVPQGRTMQEALFDFTSVRPFKTQLLKWIGNKQRFAHEIASYFPSAYGTYFEPFLGSGSVLATLSPQRAVGSDCFKPLIEIWQTLGSSPSTLKAWYAERWHQMASGDKVEGFERVKASYNACSSLKYYWVGGG